jgi:hypothetical protein
VPLIRERPADGVGKQTASVGDRERGTFPRIGAIAVENAAENAALPPTQRHPMNRKNAMPFSRFYRPSEGLLDRA